MSLVCHFKHWFSILIQLPRVIFIVLVGKIVMVLLEKLKMELKYHHYDVMNVVFCKVFYHTKTKSDNRLSIMLIFRMKMAE